MKKLSYFLLSSVFLSGCAINNTKEEKIVVAQICTTDKEAKYIKTISFNLHRANSQATQYYNSLILPTINNKPNMIGVTADNSVILNTFVGYPQDLRIFSVDNDRYNFSFQRNFNQYNENWSSWEISDPAQTGTNDYYRKDLKVRFKIIKFKEYKNIKSYTTTSQKKFPNCQ